MLRKVSKQGFSSFNVLDSFKTLKSVLYAPYRHISSFARQEGVYSTTAPNLTHEAFEEVIHEYYAAYTGNPFHLQVYNNLDNVQTTNFGTVDNPCVVFTADTPFRYVGCTGLQNEDDYEQHELHMFMLREGPLQRCSMCGQVFKLVRLRQEQDEEMYFYKDSFHPIDPFDMDNENVQMFNMFKMHSHREPSLFESSHYGMIGVGLDTDVHDRLLTDPAYRMFRHKHGEDKMKVWVDALDEAGYGDSAHRNQRFKEPLSKVAYETIIEAEKVAGIYERLQRKVYRHSVRELLDPANHERREKRMRALQKERWENNYAYFFGGMTEEEQQYNDYFKTDQEIDPDDEKLEQRLDEAEALSNPVYDPNRFDFQEQYTHNPEEDQTSILEKKFWRFRYRLAFDCTKDYSERQKRMISRQVQRLTSDPESKQIFADLKEAHEVGDKAQIMLAEQKYYKLTAKEGFLQYKDYFEGDATAEIELVEELYKSMPSAFIQIFHNHATQIFQNEGYAKFPKRPWNESVGLLENYVLDFKEFESNIKPKADRLVNQVGLQDVLPLDEQTLRNMGLLRAEQVAQKKIESSRPPKEEVKAAEPTPKAEVKVEVKVEAKSEPKTETKTETKTEHKGQRIQIKDPRRPNKH